MAVVINEFEVVPEAPRGNEPPTRAEPAPRDEPELEQVLRELQRREQRVDEY